MMWRICLGIGFSSLDISAGVGGSSGGKYALIGRKLVPMLAASAILSVMRSL